LLILAHPQPAWNRISASWAGTTTRFAIPNDQGVAQSVVNHLQDELSRYGICGPDHRTRIGMALSEALANAIIHGNLELSSTLRENDAGLFERELAHRLTVAPYRDRNVQLVAVFESAGATFVIADQGSGFDVNNVPDPTDEENLLKVTGRGLLLMRAFTDKLTFNSAGNEVTMSVLTRSRPREASTRSQTC
jgi:anti-sigma regulatory factor (Ser/Thr protein kinase)